MSIFHRIYEMMLGEPTEYRKKHTFKVRFNKYWNYHDPDRDRRLQPFPFKGETIMAYSKKDAIKRWIHADLKNRRRARR